MSAQNMHHNTSIGFLLAKNMAWWVQCSLVELLSRYLILLEHEEYL